MVGFKAAQALAFVLRRPFVGVNHHEAHLYSPWTKGSPPTADLSDFEPTFRLSSAAATPCWCTSTTN